MFGNEYGARNETERLLFQQAENQYHLEELLKKLDLEKELIEKDEQVIIKEIKEAFMENEQENLKILARKIENLRITVKRLDNLRRFIEGVFNKMTSIESESVMITAMKMITTAMTSMKELPQISQIMSKYEKEFPIHHDIDCYGNGASLMDDIARHNANVQRRENEELAINLIGKFDKEEDLRLKTLQETSENLVMKALDELGLKDMADLMWAEWESQPQKVYWAVKISSNYLSRLPGPSERIESNEREKMREAIKNKKMEEASIHALNTVHQKIQSSNYVRLSSRFKQLHLRAHSRPEIRGLDSALHNALRIWSSGQSEQSIIDCVENMSFDQISNMLDRLEKEFEKLYPSAQTPIGKTRGFFNAVQK